MLPLQGDTARAWSHTNGLPSDHVESVAVVDRKLYVALGGGYIVARDLATDAFDTVVSSRRKEKRSPLDDQQPIVHFPAMLADPTRDRVLFLADVVGKECYPLLGLWEIDTKTDRVRQVMGMHRRPSWMGSPHPAQLLIHFHHFSALGVCPAPVTGVVAFDPTTDRGRLLYGWTSGRGKARVAATGPELAEAECIAVPMDLAPPVTLVDGWLWHTTGRISPDGMISEKYPALTRAGKTRLPQWNWLQPLPDGHQVLAADSTSLWLVGLPKQPSATFLACGETAERRCWDLPNAGQPGGAAGVTSIHSSFGLDGAGVASLHSSFSLIHSARSR